MLLFREVSRKEFFFSRSPIWRILGRFLSTNTFLTTSAPVEKLYKSGRLPLSPPDNTKEHTVSLKIQSQPFVKYDFLQKTLCLNKNS